MATTASTCTEVSRSLTLAYTTEDRMKRFWFLSAAPKGGG
jgi:hypothetical protein